MANDNKVTRQIKEGARRSDIAFGIAILAIGYNLLPYKGPVEALWAGGVVIMAMGAWIVTIGIRGRGRK